MIATVTDRSDTRTRHRRWIGGAALSALFVALVLLASFPTGSDSAARTVPGGARLAASANAADVEVLVISTHGDLAVQVAYRGPKGWLSTSLPAAPTDTIASWTGTKGTGPIPALSVVYGRAPGTKVTVEWADGERTTVTTKSDGVFVAVRDSYLRSRSVSVFDDAGATVLEIEGP